MNILYITTIGGTMAFFKNFIRELLDGGHTVDIAANETDSKVPDCYREWGCEVYPLSCTRSPLASGNLKAIREIQDLAAERHYDIVHCHTPIAAACTRLACRRFRKRGTKVIYTAHGFHFFKGAPLKNWLIYFPVEWLCSFMTDTLITINQEDFAFAKKHLHAKKTEYVPGVGIDTKRFADCTVDRAKKRRELGVPEDAVLLLSVGELNENKNQRTVIEALGKLQNPKIHYCVVGIGEGLERLKALAKSQGVEPQVHFLGYRTDVAELDKAADLFVLPSFREGLNVSLMEAMAAGLPCIAGRIRGNVDLLGEDSPFAVAPTDVDAFARAISVLCGDKALRAETGARNAAAVQKFDARNVNRKMLELYGGF